MVAGKRAFEGSTANAVMAAILEREAPVVAPEKLNRVLQACLAKDPGERFQSARDLRRAIEWIPAGGSEIRGPVEGRPAVRSWM